MITYEISGLEVSQLNPPIPLVIESYRKKEYKGVIYSRRLRISPYTAHLIDEKLGTHVRLNGYRTKFVVLDLEDIKSACEILKIEFKPINTYFHIDFKMCSFKTI
jgi:hypothetical protein